MAKEGPERETSCTFAWGVVARKIAGGGGPLAEKGLQQDESPSIEQPRRFEADLQSDGDSTRAQPCPEKKRYGVTTCLAQTRTTSRTQCADSRAEVGQAAELSVVSGHASTHLEAKALAATANEATTQSRQRAA